MSACQHGGSAALSAFQPVGLAADGEKFDGLKKRFMRE
jgi:hypothetical protein